MKEMREVLYDILGDDLTSGEVLRGLRIKSGLSQEQLSELTGLKRPNISGLEKTVFK